MSYLKRILVSLIGMTSMGIGLNLLLLIDFGFGPFDSLTYLVQNLFSINSFGNASLLLHSFFAIILLFYYVIKKENILFIFLSVLTVFISTRIVNLFTFLQNLPNDNVVMTIMYFIVGFIILSFGVLLIAKANLVIPPFDKTVVEISTKFNFEVGSARIICDSSLLVVTIICAFIFKIDVPFSIGTVIITFGTGYLMSLIDKYLFKNMEFK